MRYEYEVVSGVILSKLEKILNQRGELGWRLVSRTLWLDNTYVLVFERNRSIES